MSSKRSSRTGAKKVNRDLLDRARQQAQSLESQSVEDEATDDVEEEAAAPIARRASSASASRLDDGGSRRRSTAARLREQNKETRKKAMTTEDVYDILAHPTKIVTEDELHAQYGFVLSDLRNMGVLALATFIGLIALAFVLPH
jgi:hypothetical protein